MGNHIHIYTMENVTKIPDDFFVIRSSLSRSLSVALMEFLTATQ